MKTHILATPISLIGLSNSLPAPLPEGGPAPEASQTAIDWWNVAYKNHDPHFDNFELYLNSVPEDAGHCPPTDWVMAFWDNSMRSRKFEHDQTERWIDEAYRHCKPLCMNIFPTWWEMVPNFDEMYTMPHNGHHPITAQRILEEVNGRNCPCIHCLRYPGELLFYNETTWHFYEDNPFLYLTEENGYNGWEGCQCEPLGEPEGEAEAEPESESE